LKNTTEKITTQELIDLIQTPSVKLVDIRPVEAYNGWTLNNEKRGGHIKGAKSLPAKWLQYFDWIEMVRKKQLHPEHTIIVYGYENDETEAVAERFRQSGYGNVQAYHHFKDEWSANADLPMQKLERFNKLVSAVWVNQLISGEKLQHYDNDKFIVVHAHYRNRYAYLSGHIPGAIDMDTLALEASETWNRRSPEELKNALENHGITSNTTVVLYGKFMFPDNADEFPGSAAGDICATIPVHPELAVDTPEAIKMLAAKDAELVCVRSYPEYIGEVSGYMERSQKYDLPMIEALARQSGFEITANYFDNRNWFVNSLWRVTVSPAIKTFGHSPGGGSECAPRSFRR